MIKEKIDIKYKESLGNLRRQPRESVWSGIETALNNTSFPINAPKKKNKFIFWYFSGAAILVASLFLFYLKSCDNNSLSANTSTLNSKSAFYTSSDVVGISKSENKLNHSDIQENTKGEENSKSAISDENVVMTKVNTINISTASTSTKSDKIKNKITQHFSSKKKDVAKNNFKKEENFVSINNEIKEEKEIKTELVPSNTKETPTTYISNDDQAILKDISTELNEKSEVPVYQAEETNGISSPDETQSKAGVRHSTGFSMDLIAGPNYILSNKKAVYDFESPSIIQKPISNILQPNLKVDLKYHIDNFYVASGIGYSIIGENIKYIVSNLMHDTTGGFATYSTKIHYDTVDFYTDPNFPGVYFPVLGNPRIDTISSFWNKVDNPYNENVGHKSSNRFKYIDVPIYVGYQLSYNRFTFDISTGISFSFKIGTEGNIVNNNTFNTIDNSNDPYKNTFVNYMLAVGVGYQISNKLSLVAKPIYRTNINSMFKEEINGNVRYQSVGLNFGINYKF